MKPVRLLGSGSMWRKDPTNGVSPVPDDSVEPCHVLPDIVGADIPETWNHKDIIVCEVCKGAWYVETNFYNPELSQDDSVWWEPITFWRHPFLTFDAEEMLATIEGIHLGEGVSGEDGPR